jgi:hypothetical protein
LQFMVEIGWQSDLCLPFCVRVCAPRADAQRPSSRPSLFFDIALLEEADVVLWLAWIR